MSEENVKTEGTHVADPDPKASELAGTGSHGGPAVGGVLTSDEYKKKHEKQIGEHVQKADGGWEYREAGKPESGPADLPLEPDSVPPVGTESARIAAEQEAEAERQRLAGLTEADLIEAEADKRQEALKDEAEQAQEAEAKAAQQGEAQQGS